MLAMADNRTYGLDLDAGQTVQPQPFTSVGDGAGSIFKIFTTAAALDMGMGINAQLDVPQKFEGTGLGSSNTPGCPPRTWCVKNAGGYRSPMSVTDALAQSPNTAFAKLIQQVGVPRAVDMAVRLGLRSYAEPGTRPRLRPEQQRQPRRLRQAAEPRLVHARPVRTQCARTVECRRDAGVGRHVVPAEPDRQGLRPPRPRGGRRDGELRTSGSRGARQHAGQCAGQGRHQRNRGRFGRLGGLEPADVGQDRHHRVPPVVGIPRASPTSTPRRTTSSTTPPTRPVCVRSRCAGVPTATCTAATNRHAPGSSR